MKVILASLLVLSVILFSCVPEGNATDIDSRSSCFVLSDEGHILDCGPHCRKQGYKDGHCEYIDKENSRCKCTSGITDKNIPQSD